jgi:hypothetical protein
VKRGGRLQRRTPLAAGKPLARKTPLREVSLKRAASSGKSARPRDTGPDRTTRELVLERDDWACFCCGKTILGHDYSLQHRDSRGMGGSKNPLKNSPANLITLLGSATTECHGRVEGRRTADNVAGYWLKTGQEPADTPVLHWRLGPVLLGHDGSVEPVGRAAA